jgi:hypothetical protein
MRELRTSGSVGARRGDSPGYPTVVVDGDGVVDLVGSGFRPGITASSSASRQHQSTISAQVHDAVAVKVHDQVQVHDGTPAGRY